MCRPPRRRILEIVGELREIGIEPLVEQFAGARKQVREQAVQFALKLLIEHTR